MSKSKSQDSQAGVVPVEGVMPIKMSARLSTIVKVGSAESIALNVRYGFKQEDFVPLARDLSVTTALSEEVTLAFIERGHAILLQHVGLGRKYINLCEFIREESIGPVQAREILFALGFHKVRVSEILRVAMCADELWNKYRARELSMQKVLQVERGGVVLETLDLDDAEKDVAGVGEVVGKTLGTADAAGRKLSTHVSKVGKVVKALQVLCGKEWQRYKKRREYASAGNGIVVTIECIPLESVKGSREVSEVVVGAVEKVGAL